MARLDKTTIPAGGTPIWVVETSLDNDFPPVTMYQAKEIRDTGVLVYFRAGVRFVGPAHGRKFFTDRTKLVEYLKRYMEESRDSHRRRAARLDEALLALPGYEVSIVPPVVRGEHDKRMEI